MGGIIMTGIAKARTVSRRRDVFAAGQKIEHPTLRGLLDDLEETFRPDAHTSRRGIPQ
jgi:hypothetical protein